MTNPNDDFQVTAQVIGAQGEQGYQGHQGEIGATGSQGKVCTDESGARPRCAAANAKTWRI